MARPISWLSSVRELHRSVCNSVRTHYQRRDIQSLFKLQPRAAQKLIEMLPRTEVGATLIVEKDDLAVFLDRMRNADNPSKMLEEIRAEKAPVKREKMRTLLRYDARDALSLPDTVYLRRGKLEVNFRTAQQLAEAMLAIAKIIETEEFEQDYTHVVRTSLANTDAGRELRALFLELEEMERARVHSGPIM